MITPRSPSPCFDLFLEVFFFEKEFFTNEVEKKLQKPIKQ
jgi:hypothetical protein